MFVFVCVGLIGARLPFGVILKLFGAIRVLEGNLNFCRSYDVMSLFLKV